MKLAVSQIFNGSAAAGLLAALMFASVPAVAQKNPGPPTQNVLVVNGSGQPVPTAPQGTTNIAGTVNIGNMPSVSVANTPNVSIANTPGVNVVNSSLPVTGSVSINGTPNVNISNGSLNVTPSPSDPGSPNFMPTAANNNAVASGGTCTVSVPGPDGSHRLVIEQISAYGQIQPASSRVLETDISENGTFRIHYFAPSSQTPDGIGDNNWLVSQPTRLYIDPGNNVTLTVSGDVNVTGGNCALYYTGYLIPTS